MKGTLVVLAVLIGMASVALAVDQASKPAENLDLASAVIERTITYQGILKDNSGNPVPDNTYNVTFRIYDVSVGGSALWSSGAIPVVTSDGFFTRELGPITLPFDETYYLSIQIPPDGEMAQRQKVTMAAYSAVSDTANYAFGSAGGDSYWTLNNSLLFTNDYWGITRGNSGNTIRGDSTRTMINLGSFSSTGGFGNQTYCTVGGGTANNAYFSYSTVGGGEGNCAFGYGSSVGGGISDTTRSFYGGIASGYANIAGGTNPIDTAAFVGGGRFNAAKGSNSTICGGANNNAAISAFVGGGTMNSAVGLNSMIGGGTLNMASGFGSTICGGTGNMTNGDYSSILGGLWDTLYSAANYSLAFGRSVYVSTGYRFYIYNSEFPGCLGLNRDSRDGGTTFPIHVGTNSSNGNGAYLTPTGTWTNGSSRTFKENFISFDGGELLSKISNLSVTTYNYKNSTEKHVGPVAEEFVGAFDVGVIRENDGKRDDQYLAASDVAGVALAGVQELFKQNQALKAENENMKTMIANLEGRMAELENNR
jgi:hypothetical protein